MYPLLYTGPRSIRVLYLTFTSDIRVLTKPHISKYSHFRLLISINAKRPCAAKAYVPVISSYEYTIGEKERLHFRQGCRYLYFFSFSAVVRAFANV